MKVRSSDDASFFAQSHKESSIEQQGQFRDRSVDYAPVSKDLKRSVSEPDLSHPQQSIDQRTVKTGALSDIAGRGKVQSLENGRIEKQMGKWGVINYARIFQNPKNESFVKFFPAELIWRCSEESVIDLREIQHHDGVQRTLRDSANAQEFPVEMTNVAPSGRLIDIKLGDIVSATADKIHGKSSLK